MLDISGGHWEGCLVNVPNIAGSSQTIKSAQLLLPPPLRLATTDMWALISAATGSSSEGFSLLCWLKEPLSLVIWTRME